MYISFITIFSISLIWPNPPEMSLASREIANQVELGLKYVVNNNYYKKFSLLVMFLHSSTAP